MSPVYSSSPLPTHPSPYTPSPPLTSPHRLPSPLNQQSSPQLHKLLLSRSPHPSHDAAAHHPATPAAADLPLPAKTPAVTVRPVGGCVHVSGKPVRRWLAAHRARGGGWEEGRWGCQRQLMRNCQWDGRQAHPPHSFRHSVPLNQLPKRALPRGILFTMPHDRTVRQHVGRSFQGSFLPVPLLPQGCQQSQPRHSKLRVTRQLRGRVGFRLLGDPPQ